MGVNKQTFVTLTPISNYILQESADKRHTSISAAVRTALERHFAQKIELVEQRIDNGELVIRNGVIWPADDVMNVRGVSGNSKK